MWHKLLQMMKELTKWPIQQKLPARNDSEFIVTSTGGRKFSPKKKKKFLQVVVFSSLLTDFTLRKLDGCMLQHIINMAITYGCNILYKDIKNLQ